MSTAMGELSGVEVLLFRPSPFGNESGSLPNGVFAPGEETVNFVKNECNILVIGAGGLGCELLKDLVLSGFKNIHVIDLDTVDVTNLNRQFLFRNKDVGSMKAECAANFINARMPNVGVTFSTCPIQDKDESFYRQFSVIIAGLDNIKARRWINALLVSMVKTDEDHNIIPESVIPLIDGGSEAFKGQARLILPRVTSCFECSMDSFPPQTHFPLCTVADTPRKPDHCIAYILFAVQKALSNPEADKIHTAFVDKFGTNKLDRDSPLQMRFIFEYAQTRAETFNIEGVTYMLTIGVVKNIIPAVASTNAVIAAACVNEAFKILSWGSQSLNSYWMYNGTTGVYSYTFQYEKRYGCPVCDTIEMTREVNKDLTLGDFIDELKTDMTLQLEKPSLAKPGLSLFMQQPQALRVQLLPNLEKKMVDLVSNGDIISVTDPVFPLGQSVEIVIKLV